MTLPLPASLLPPLERPRGVSATAGESLTRAVLAAIEHGTPFPLSIAADIAAHRWHFAGIPGVLS